MVTIENTLKNEISIFSCAPFKEKSKNFALKHIFETFLLWSALEQLQK